jgi:hypothetical protein
MVGDPNQRLHKWYLLLIRVSEWSNMSIRRLLLSEQPLLKSNLAYIPVFKPHIHKRYILRHCTNIIYIYSSRYSDLPYRGTF